MHIDKLIMKCIGRRKGTRQAKTISKRNNKV